MSKKNQFRFYDILPCYLDDERLAAFAIVELGTTDSTAEEIYRHLLNCHYGKWIDQLEQIADETRYDVLKEWCEQKQFDLDMMDSLFWSPGDSKIIECNGWKLIKGNEDDESEE